MNPVLFPCVPRTFLAADIVALPSGSAIDLVKGRPGYSVADGGPPLASGATHDTRDKRTIKPTRLRLETNGTIIVRHLLGRTEDDTVIYDDQRLIGFAGELLDICSPDFIVRNATIGGVTYTTSADFTVGWPTA